MYTCGRVWEHVGKLGLQGMPYRRQHLETVQYNRFKCLDIFWIILVFSSRRATGMRGFFASHVVPIQTN